MELQQLDYFVHVCDSGSFSRAAAGLHLTQPTLSRQIGLLEESLGQRLLERTGRGVTPTEAGNALLPHARALLAMARCARDELRDLEDSPMGNVVVGLPPRLAHDVTVSLIQQFRDQFPRATLSIQEGLSIHLREWLISGRLDIALLFDPQQSPALNYEVLQHEPLMLVAARQVVLPDVVDIKSLGAYPLILPAVPNALRVLIDAVLRPYGVTLDIVAEVGAAQTIVQLVSQNAGCTILPKGAVLAYHAESAIKMADIGPPAICNSLVLATPLARPSNRLTSAVMNLLRAMR